MIACIPEKLTRLQKQADVTADKTVVGKIGGQRFRRYLYPVTLERQTTQIVMLEVEGRFLYDSVERVVVHKSKYESIG